MNDTMLEVIRFVEENDVKFIRLAFCDLFGVQKNISILPDELPRAFESGISFDASAVRGFLNVAASDLCVKPDPATLAILPWRPAHGRVMRLFCDVIYPDGRPFEGDGRGILRSAVEQAETMGYRCRVGSECEFYLFRLDDDGQPTLTPHDEAGYLDIAPLDRGENVRRDICLTLEEMGIHPESSHHEQGPGQNEVDFRYGDALLAADDLVTFQSVVRTIAARNGLHATFMPKPLQEASGSGLHINLSLTRDGRNIFRTGQEHSWQAEAFIAGVLHRAAEMTVFLNPTVNSYERLGRMEAPGYVTWSHQNRSQLVRIPAAGGEYARMELRSPDPSANPYLAFALLIRAGLEGVASHRLLPPASDFDVFTATAQQRAGLVALPDSLEAAIRLARDSAFLQEMLPEATLTRYLAEKEAEAAAIAAAPDGRAAQLAHYFHRL